MTSSESPQAAPARRSRRAVRHAGTVGGDDADLVSTHPALGAGTPQPDAGAGDARRSHAADTPQYDAGDGDARRGHAADTPPVDGGAVDTGVDRGTGDAREVPGRAGDGRPSATQRAHEPLVATRSADDSDVGWGDREAGSNDDRLQQDKPPHW